MCNVEIGTVFHSLSGVRGVHDGPRQGVDEWHHQVDQRPANDDVVVGHDAERGEDGRCADTREPRVYSSEHSNVTALELLAETKLHEGHRNTNGEKADPVGDEEEGTAPLEAQIGEAPEVSEADTVANHSQDESGTAQPAGSLSIISLIREKPRSDVFRVNTEECRPRASLFNLHLSLWFYLKIILRITEK